MKKLHLAFAALAIAAVVACAPVANVARTIVEDADGASISYLVDGIGFNPGEQIAVGVEMVVTGDTLTVVDERCNEVSDTRVDCSLGDVVEPTAVIMSGTDVLAIATFRRAGANAIYRVVGQ